MTANDFAPLFDRLWSAFGWSAPVAERHERSAIFLRALADLPTASVAVAVDEAVKREERFPKPAWLRRAAETHLASMRAAVAPVRSRLEGPNGEPRCPECGTTGPFVKHLQDDAGNWRYFPDDHPEFPGEPLTRFTMEHDCRAWRVPPTLPTTPPDHRLPAADR